MASVETRSPHSSCADLAARYAAVRRFSERLCETLVAEDCCIQSMPDVSPTRWHLAHTTWFFETFVLANSPDYRPGENQFTYLFNSYYNAIGEQFPRAQRGLLSRPTVAEVMAYRQAIDEQMQEILEEESASELRAIVELGLNHEQQHQELMLTDIKHVFSCNPLWPVYRNGKFRSAAAAPLAWHDFEEGLYRIGQEGDDFAYDNESPRHRVFLESFRLASRPATCGEYLDFMADGGYARPELWLAEGWRHVCEQRWHAPLYWVEADGKWQEFTLAGLVPVDTERPVCHVSYFEADAFARWSEARLPTEAEWETASELASTTGNFADQLIAHKEPVHPGVSNGRDGQLAQMFGDVWEWTASSYAPYPGYQPAAGAIGEYNGKFMCNQYVLRGGSCATPSGHVRPTYRNFFPSDARWQFSGIRLAR